MGREGRGGFDKTTLERTYYNRKCREYLTLKKH